MLQEKKVQNDIVYYLKRLSTQHPILVERRQAGGFSYKKGIPDLYAIINGIHLEIEVKAPGKTLTVMQEKYKRKCERLNIAWCCVDNIYAFKQYLYNKFNIYAE